MKTLSRIMSRPMPNWCDKYLFEAVAKVSLAASIAIMLIIVMLVGNSNYDKGMLSQLLATLRVLICLGMSCIAVLAIDWYRNRKATK